MSMNLIMIDRLALLHSNLPSALLSWLTFPNLPLESYTAPIHQGEALIKYNINTILHGARIGLQTNLMCKQLLKALGCRSVTLITSMVQKPITCPLHRDLARKQVVRVADNNLPWKNLVRHFENRVCSKCGQRNHTATSQDSFPSACPNDAAYGPNDEGHFSHTPWGLRCPSIFSASDAGKREGWQCQIMFSWLTGRIRDH